VATVRVERPQVVAVMVELVVDDVFVAKVLLVTCSIVAASSYMAVAEKASN